MSEDYWALPSWARRVDVREEDVILSTFAIYSNPTDFPGKFVVRRWVVVHGEDQPLATLAPTIVCETLDAAREALPPGLFPFLPTPEDDPKIVEIWL